MKVKNLKKSSKTNWEQLATMPDDAIDFSDSPELDTDFFKNATLVLPKPKKAVSLRLDSDVLDWFKHRGSGYQTRINAVLRMYVGANVQPRKRILSRKTALHHS